MRPEPAAALEELRLLVALLPMRIRLDQLVCQFLAAFFALQETTVLVAAPPAGGGDAPGVEAGSEAGATTGELRAKPC